MSVRLPSLRLPSAWTETVWAVLWAVMFVLLPVTSFPWVVRLVQSDTVAAPSGVVLLGLVVAWLLPSILRGSSLPRQCLPLLALTLFALLVTLVSAFAPIPAYKGLNPLREELKSILTLLVGVCFFLIASAWPVTERRLRWTLALINLSGLVMIAWSLTQSGAWYAFHRYPPWLRSIQEFFSVGPLYRQRTAGFTLEPSWLAHQLNMLYLPLWLAASVRGYSAHRKLWGISLENVLLALGAVVLWLTLSRVGLLAFLLAVAYLLIGANLRLAAWIQSKVALRSRARSVKTGIFAGLFGVYGIVLAGLAYGLSVLDPRMRHMFDFSFGADALLRYANQLSFATRLVYWQAGWNIFGLSPFTGVGLGNAGFYFPQTLPAFAWKLEEVHDLIHRSAILLNIKSIWVRLLAETGIVGFALFCTWVVLVWFSARRAASSGSALLRTFGLAGQFVLIAFLVEGFSIDSFALPYLWISTGLVTAAAEICSSRSAPGRVGMDGRSFADRVSETSKEL